VLVVLVGGHGADGVEVGPGFPVAVAVAVTVAFVFAFGEMGCGNGE
jgi:hypothetical protein